MRASTLRLALIGVLVGLLLAAARPASAHNEMGLDTIGHAVIGHYDVMLSASALRIGQNQLIATVVDTRTNEPVRDATLTVTLVGHEGGAPRVVTMTPAGTMLHPEYAGMVRLLSAGVHDVKVQVSDASGAVGAAQFETTVVTLTVLKWVILALSVQAALAGVWMLKEGLVTWGLLPRPQLSPTA